MTTTPRPTQPSLSAVVLSNMPTLRWGIDSCGAGSLATVLQHYGDPTTMTQWDSTLPKTRGGVMTIDLLLAARGRGFDAQLVTGTPALVDEHLRAGNPIILMLRVIDAPGRGYDFFHYIVADGIDAERGLIRAQFGDGRGRWIALSQVEEAWSGGGHAAIVIQPKRVEEQIIEEIADALLPAVALEDEGKWAEAIEHYRHILAEHPESVVAWTDLGNAERQRGNAAGAEQAYRRALSLDPTSRDALNNLAWLFFQQERFSEAESLARKAVGQPGPDRYLILDTLARILAAKGECAEAIRTFQQAIDAVPSSRAEARAGIDEAYAAARRACSPS